MSCQHFPHDEVIYCAACAKDKEKAQKAAKLEVLDMVLEMLIREAADRNCDGVYRLHVPLEVAKDELEVMKKQIEGE